MMDLETLEVLVFELLDKISILEEKVKLLERYSQ